MYTSFIWYQSIVHSMHDISLPYNSSMLLMYITRFSCREYADNTWCPSMSQRWCYVDVCSETSSIAHVLLIDYLKVVGCIQGAVYLSSPPSLHYLSAISLTLRIILHILIVIHVFNWSMDHYHNDPWSSLYALMICPIFCRSVMLCFTPVNCYITASRSCCSASNAGRFFRSIDADNLHHVKDLLECSWDVSRCFIYRQQWTLRVMTHHHYHHRDDDATAIMNHWTSNMWRNHGSNDRILWQCYGGIYRRLLWHWKNIVTMSMFSMIHLHHYLSIPYLVVVVIVPSRASTSRRCEQLKVYLASLRGTSGMGLIFRAYFPTG